MGKKIAGVVLAGGKSSRMGQNKALLDYNGQPLLVHMIEILKQAGLEDIYVSGDLKGYRCIPDNAPHEGPAHAIVDVLKALDNYDGVLFVPVDMPLLSAEMLKLLIREKKGGYFMGSPLPVLITEACFEKPAKSVKALLESLRVYPIILPPELEDCMINTNTPQEWARVLRA